MLGRHSSVESKKKRKKKPVARDMTPKLRDIQHAIDTIDTNSVRPAVILPLSLSR